MNKLRNLALASAALVATTLANAQVVYGSAEADTAVDALDAGVTKWQTWVIAITMLSVILGLVKRGAKGR